MAIRSVLKQSKISIAFLSFVLGVLFTFVGFMIIPAVTLTPITNPPIDICFVREMKFIPEIDSWPSYTPSGDAILEQTRLVQEEWGEKIAKQLQKEISPALVQELSRWAESEMEEYKRIPPFSNVELTPITEFKNGGPAVFKVTLDTLPSHSPLVTRWLLVYVLYDAHIGTIERIVITIRGELLE